MLKLSNMEDELMKKFRNKMKKHVQDIYLVMLLIMNLKWAIMKRIK